jgi:hypothetical protein
MSFSKTDWNADSRRAIGDDLGVGLRSLTPGETVFDSIISSIVIMNLIANLPFLYHNLETAGDLH